MGDAAPAFLEILLTNNDLFDNEAVDSTDELVISLTRSATLIFLKKLSLNDWQWTEDPDKHQGGAYIFTADRDSGFFPPLTLKPRGTGMAEIREVFIPISWPMLGAHFAKTARLVNYRSKGEETHLTGLPPEELSDLAPASFLLIAKEGDGATVNYRAITVDSRSGGYLYIEDLFGIGPDFRSGIFEPQKAVRTFQENLFDFVGQALEAFRAGELPTFAAAHLAIPKPREMAKLARQEYRNRHGNLDFNPFTLARPGDVVREISRGIEYELYKGFEIRRRSMELVQLILGSDPAAVSVQQALINIITEFPKIDGILLSAAQTRKSRAGASFELHIERLLIDGAIPHEVQVVIDAKKRPDFVLPSLTAFRDEGRGRDGALVLSAKTTLRERWKQVQQEMQNCDLFLATVDETIAQNAIEDMGRQGIVLVVPESLKASDTTAYSSQENVISFKTFFETVLRDERVPLWRK